MQPNLLIVGLAQAARLSAKVIGVGHHVVTRHVMQYPTPRLPTAHGAGHTLTAHDHGDLKAGTLRHGVDQVSLEILMLGNLLEKSLAFAAIFTAT
jgi:hypothetical protein